MKTILILFISVVFSFCSFAQEPMEANVKDSLAFSYNFTSYVKNDSKMQDNMYSREVEVYKSHVIEKIMKYDFFCVKFEIKGPNNVSYLKKVAYAFDEISVLVDENGKIIEVTKPDDMDERWQKTKKKILLDYKGEVITNYLKQIDQTIENKEKLIAFLQSDNMYGFFLKAVTAIDNVPKSSKIKVKRRKKVKIITPKTESKTETEQYIFKDNILNYAVKKVGNIKYEIKFLAHIKP